MDLLVIQDFLADLSSKKSVRYLALVMVIALIGVGAAVVYQYFVNKNAQAAHQAFSDGMAEFEKDLRGDPAKQHWDEIARTFKAGYDRYQNTALGPYFLAYESQAQLYNNKHEAALEAVNQLVKSIKKSSPLYYLYAIKRALMKMDAQSESVRKEGLEELTVLAHDRQNPQRDAALYYLGYNAFSQGNRTEAQKAWSTLISQFGTGSEWSALAEEKVASMKKAVSSKA